MLKATPEPSVPQRTWLFENDKLIELSNIPEEKREKRNGRYYERATYYIKVSEDVATAGFSYVYGPLFGGGYTCEVEQIGDYAILGKKLIRMIS